VGCERERQFRRKSAVELSFSNVAAFDEELIGRHSSEIRQDGCIL
jgi:hypothetical protein